MILPQQLLNPKIKPKWRGSLGIVESAVAYNCRIHGFPIPVLAMPFWEGAGNKAYDLSGKMNHGDITGGKWNTNLILNDNGNGSSNDYVYRNTGKLATHAGNSWSVFIISKMYAENTHSHLFNQKCADIGAGGFYFNAGAGTMSLGYMVPGASTWGVYDTFTYGLNTTHAWSIVHDSVAVKTYVYKDGVGKQATLGAGQRSTDTFNDGFYLGRCINWNNYYGWDGEVSCAYVFDKVALTPYQIKFLHDNPYFMFQPISVPYGYAAAAVGGLSIPIAMYHYMNH